MAREEEILARIDQECDQILQRFETIPLTKELVTMYVGYALQAAQQGQHAISYDTIKPLLAAMYDTLNRQSKLDFLDRDNIKLTGLSSDQRQHVCAVIEYRQRLLSTQIYYCVGTRMEQYLYEQRHGTTEPQTTNNQE